VVREQPQCNDKNTTKCIYNPIELRKFYIQVLNQLILERSGGVKGLVLNEEIKTAINLICQYLNHEPEFINNEGFNFNKGLWLYGAFGSGKTQLIKAYRTSKKILFRETVGFKTCVQMNEAFKRIDKFLNEPQRYNGIDAFANKFDTKERIFDDLGAEEITINDFGNKLCIMEHILSERSKGFPKVKTHITTNLSMNQISSDYGGRIDSRSYEMFNFILLGKGVDSIDHRKTK